MLLMEGVGAWPKPSWTRHWLKLAGDFNNLSLIRGDVFQGRYKSIGFVFVLLSDSMSFVVAGRNYSFCFLLSRCPSSYGEFAVPKTLKK